MEMVEKFGEISCGATAKIYYLKNKNGMEIAVSDYGATLVKLLVQDKDGCARDVVLGYDSVREYELGGAHFGATVGRVANRIAGASFSLNGQDYPLTANDNGNSLHGGKDFYNKRMWSADVRGENSVTFVMYSPDKDQGYPGAMDVSVTYTLTDENEVKIHYRAVPDADTLINLTNHSYFNLAGHSGGEVLDQEVMINADTFTIADAQSIPTGEFVPVEGTPMDFRSFHQIGERIGADYEPLIFGNGYDHNWVLNGTGLRKAAAMRCVRTGIQMEVFTDLPGMQFYTANFVEKEKGKEGAVYDRRHAACFETQFFPDAVHKAQFKSPVVRAGTVYETTTVYKFFV